MDFENYIRSIPDYPKPGIIFKDITPLLLQPEVFAQAIQEMAKPFKADGIDIVVGAEARGFIFGPPVAMQLKAGFVPIRKPGKLPGATIAEEYTLEYGTATLEMHNDQLPQGARVLILDDLLATGGTMEAAAKLVERVGGVVAGFSFLIELSFLNGRDKLGDKKNFSLIRFSGE